MNPSDHFNGKTFFQPGAHPERGFGDFLKWRFTSRPARWPRQVALSPQPPPPAPAGDEMVITWLGHASFLVQTAKANILFDPVFSERTSPVRFVGPRRVHPVPLSLEALPPIDAVFVTHDHYDHFDAPTLRWLAKRSDRRAAAKSHGSDKDAEAAGRSETVFIAPLRHRDLLTKVGARRIVELDWWESCVITPGLTLALTPTKHWSNRLGTPRNHRLWGGGWMEFSIFDSRFSIADPKPRPDAKPEMSTTSRDSAPPKRTRAESAVSSPVPATERQSLSIQNPESKIEYSPAPPRRLWFVGDSGYDEALFREIHARFGSPDVALVPIGAYEPRWFMAPMHMNPDEAVRLHCDTGARLSIAMHWGTFQLTDEAREEPPRALEQARKAHGVSDEAFRVIKPGESVVA